MKDINLELKLKNTESSEVSDEIEAIAEELAEKDAQEWKSEGELLARDAYKARLKEQYKEVLSMDDLGKSLSEAVEIIRSEGLNCLTFDELSEITTDFENGFKKLDVINLLENLDQTFQELCGMRDRTLKSIEKIGKHKFLEQDYASSNKIYLLLCTLDSVNFDYFNRLGITYQECRLWDEALSAYSQALEIYPDHIATHLFMAECYVAKEDRDKSKEKLEVAKQLIRNQNALETWESHVAVLEEVINKL